MPALGLEVTFGSCGSLIYGFGGFHYFPPQYHGHSPMPLQQIGPNKFATLWLATVGQKPPHCARLSVFTTSPLEEEEHSATPLWEGKKEDDSSYRKGMKKESCFVPNIVLDNSLQLEVEEHAHFYIDAIDAKTGYKSRTDFISITFMTILIWKKNKI